MDLNEELKVAEEMLELLESSEYKKDKELPSIKLSYVILEKRNQLNWSRKDLLEKLEEKNTPMTEDELAHVEAGDNTFFPDKFNDVLKALGAKGIHYKYLIEIEFEDEEKIVEA